MAKHTAKTNILLITETQISMPNLPSDERTAKVRPEPLPRKPFPYITNDRSPFTRQSLKKEFPRLRKLAPAHGILIEGLCTYGYGKKLSRSQAQQGQATC